MGGGSRRSAALLLRLGKGAFPATSSQRPSNLQGVECRSVFLGKRGNARLLVIISAHLAIRGPGFHNGPSIFRSIWGGHGLPLSSVWSADLMGCATHKTNSLNFCCAARRLSSDYSRDRSPRVGPLKCFADFQALEPTLFLSAAWPCIPSSFYGAIAALPKSESAFTSSVARRSRRGKLMRLLKVSNCTNGI
jgi:hypothetical protein